MACDDENTSNINDLTQENSNFIAEIFGKLAEIPRWIPYKLVPLEDGRFNKVPFDGRCGLSTKNKAHWFDLATVAGIVLAEPTVHGFGLVFTDGIVIDGWRLVGFDADQINPEKFELPFEGYWERSPSGTGIHQLVWVPESWARGLKNKVGIPYPNCDHLDLFVGSTGKGSFLTASLDYLEPLPIPRLEGDALASLGSWFGIGQATALGSGHKLPEQSFEPIDIGKGKPVDLTRYNLTPNQQALINGELPKGKRSEVMHGLLIKWIDAGESREDCLATLCQPGPLWDVCTDHWPSHPEDYAKREVQCAYGASVCGKRERLSAYNAKWGESSEEPSENAFPLDLYHSAPGLVGEIAHWIMGASHSPREEFAYACALSMVACLIGPYVTLPGGGMVNLYLVLEGETGAGKNQAFDTMAKLLSATDAKNCIQDFPASEPALRRTLTVQPNVLLRVDELAHKLESMNGAHNSNGAGLYRALLEAYTGARMPPKNYADERKSLPAVEHPYVQIMSGTTSKVWEVLTSAQMDDGTLNRFLFICLPDDLPYRHQTIADDTIPKDLKDRLNAFFRDGKRYDLIGEVEGTIGRHLTYGEEVEKALDNLDKVAWDKQHRDAKFAGLFTRYAENTARIAAILAVGDGKSCIGMREFEQAQRFMEWCLENTYRKCSLVVADSAFEGLIKRLLKKLRSAGGKLSMRDAYRFLSIKKREMDDLTDAMLRAGHITVLTEGNEIVSIHLPGAV